MGSKNGNLFAEEDKIDEGNTFDDNLSASDRVVALDSKSDAD